MSGHTPTPAPWGLRWTEHRPMRPYLVSERENACDRMLLAHLGNAADDVKTETANAKLIVAAVNSYGRLPDPLQAAEEDLLGASLSALDALLQHYVRLVESGDAGFWDAETEPEVIAARALLAKTKA